MIEPERDERDPKPPFAIDAAVVRAAWRFAVALAGESDADDILQDALARAWERRDVFDSNRGSMTSWVLSIVADQRRQQLRRRAVRNKINVPEQLRLSAVESDSAIDVRRALHRLPPLQRSTIILFYYVDLSISDIASILERSVGTVKSTLFDARRSLANQLGADYVRH